MSTLRQFAATIGIVCMVGIAAGTGSASPAGKVEATTSSFIRAYVAGRRAVATMATGARAARSSNRSSTSAHHANGRFSAANTLPSTGSGAISPGNTQLNW